MRNLLEATLGIVNGAVGDYLARTENGLATPMECIHDGAPLPVERAALSRAHPLASPRVVVLVHGVMCTEDVWEPADGTGDYGARLAEDLGYTPLYLRYNTGLSIPENGAALAELLEQLVDQYPTSIEEILPLGFSMGGLVIRSACHVATLRAHRWLGRVRRAIYVGVPHLGAPLERAGRVLAGILGAIPDPYTRLVADIGNLRSIGIKDLGDAHPVPLLPGIRHYLVAGTLWEHPSLAALLGDALVPVPSGTAGGALPAGHVKVVSGVQHLSLARHPEVYAQIRAWCREDGT